MPVIRKKVTAATDDALANLNFSVVPAPGAILNLWASTATAGDTIGLNIGSQNIIAPGTPVNLESANEVVDNDRDQMLFNEVVGPGRLQLPLGTVTLDTSFILDIRYLPAS